MKIGNRFVKVIFWGSSEFSLHVLNNMKSDGMIPDLIVTTPPKPQGRGLIMTPNVVETWAKINNISCLTPIRLKDSFDEINKQEWDLSIVASYGKIIPENILNIPKYKSINIHPSLLPKYRGPSPLQSAILDDQKNTGVSIMLMDKEMDHGPVISQNEIIVSEWTEYEKFEENMAIAGSRLLTETIIPWIDNTIVAKEQNHKEATFTRKFEKNDGLVDLCLDDPYLIFRKYCAFHIWPNIFFDIKFDENKSERFKITSLKYNIDGLKIMRVRGQNGKEISFSDLLNQLKGSELYKSLQRFLLSQ